MPARFRDSFQSIQTFLGCLPVKEDDPADICSGMTPDRWQAIRFEQPEATPEPHRVKSEIAHLAPNRQLKRVNIT